MRNNSNPIWNEQVIYWEKIPSLNDPLRAVISDSSGRNSIQKQLGFIDTTVNLFIQESKLSSNSKGGDGILLLNQPRNALGRVNVEKAELVNYSNLKIEATTMRLACASLQQS